jgi:deoxyribose-phosphate aldolase
MNPRLANRRPLTNLAGLDEATLMGCIDHALLRPEMTRQEVEAGVDVALAWQTATVCCRPADLPMVVSRLRRSVVSACTVIGFPHGTNAASIKKREAMAAVDAGAVELDVVINFSALRSGDFGVVRDELSDLVYAVAPVPVKMILETGYLAPEQVEMACRISLEARASFVKNGTGFSPRGADPEEIAMMRRIVGDNVGVKASGGIRTLDRVLAMLAAGACRVGASATDAIGNEWRARGPEALEALAAAGAAS